MDGSESRRGSKLERASKLLLMKNLTKLVNRTSRPESASSNALSAGVGKTMEPKIENTYQMEPAKKFPEANVRDILKEVLAETLAEVNYEPNTCRQLTKTISDDVRHRVKEMRIPRYKIICLVHIGKLGKQAMRVGSRCLWDTNFDTYTSYEYKNGSIFAVATVYGVYFE